MPARQHQGTCTVLLEHSVRLLSALLLLASLAACALAYNDRLRVVPASWLPQLEPAVGAWGLCKGVLCQV